MKNYKITVEDRIDGETTEYETDRLLFTTINDTEADDGKEVGVQIMGHFNGKILAATLAGIFTAIKGSTGISVKTLHDLIHAAEKHAILNMDMDLELSLPDDAPEELKQVAGKLNEIVAIMKNSVK